MLPRQRDESSTEVFTVYATLYCFIDLTVVAQTLWTRTLTSPLDINHNLAVRRALGGVRGSLTMRYARCLFGRKIGQRRLLCGATSSTNTYCLLWILGKPTSPRQPVALGYDKEQRRDLSQPIEKNNHGGLNSHGTDEPVVRQAFLLIGGTDSERTTMNDNLPSYYSSRAFFFLAKSINNSTPTLLFLAGGHHHRCRASQTATFTTYMVPLI